MDLPILTNIYIYIYIYELSKEHQLYAHITDVHSCHLCSVVCVCTCNSSKFIRKYRKIAVYICIYKRRQLFCFENSPNPHTNIIVSVLLYFSLSLSLSLSLTLSLFVLQHILPTLSLSLFNLSTHSLMTTLRRSQTMITVSYRKLDTFVITSQPSLPQLK